jgi:hypothetical protein
MKLSHSKELYAEIFGEFGETGTFNVSLQNENEINKDRKNNSRNSEEVRCLVIKERPYYFVI